MAAEANVGIPSRDRRPSLEGYSLQKKVWFSIIAVLLAGFIGTGIVELSLRIFPIVEHRTPTIMRNEWIFYEPSLFSRHVLAQEEKFAHSHSGRLYYLNEKGYRGDNFTVQKPAGTTRIIFYGGSSVFDLGAIDKNEQPYHFENDWPHRVGGLLKEEGFSNIEIINAGIPSHASFDSVGRLYTEGHLFEPDYVVLYNGWNDIKYLQSEEPLLRQFKPFKQNPRREYHNGVDRFFGEHSYAYALLRRVYYRLKLVGLDIGDEGVIPPGDYASDVSDVGLDQFKLNVEMFVDLARNIGAEPILMTQARLASNDNTEEQRARILYEFVKLTPEALVSTFEKLDQIIYEVAEAKNVTVIDASGQLTGVDEYFEDHVHLTREGAEQIARLTSKALAEPLRSRR